MDNIHILPMNDLIPHTESVDCLCHPKVELEGDTQIVVHNSFDKREELERKQEVARWN